MGFRQDDRRNRKCRSDTRKRGEPFILCSPFRYGGQSCWGQSRVLSLFSPEYSI